ncbi:MAG: sensor histidine kinase [Trueperaceae bacterium]
MRSRFVLAMMAVSLVTLLSFASLESFIFIREYRQLPDTLRGLREDAFDDEEAFLAQLPPDIQTFYVERIQVYADTIQNIRLARRRTIGVATIIALLLGVALSLALAHRIAKPMAAVLRATNEMRKGNLSARVGSNVLATADRETVALAQGFNAMAETLEKNERERKHMIADIAHELRTPLAIMQARLAAIQDEVLPLNATELERIYKQTELLSRLVGDLRTLSLAEAGRLSLTLQKVDLKLLLEQVIANFESAAKLKGIRVLLETQGASLVSADSDRLTQIFTNLLDNALRYTPEGGSIILAVSVKAQVVVVSVRDGGPGLSQEALARAFDRFYKGDERSSSGLGLAIVKALVTLQKGSVTAKNHPEVGAVFEVTLPVA